MLYMMEYNMVIETFSTQSVFSTCKKRCIWDHFLLHSSRLNFQPLLRPHSPRRMYPVGLWDLEEECNDPNTPETFTHGSLISWAHDMDIALAAHKGEIYPGSCGGELN